MNPTNAVMILFPAALLALALVLVVGLRNRILGSMAYRNALRRPRQSIMIVAGLLVGTAIISGALVAGDSMKYSIVNVTLDSFEEIDETMFIDGFNFFPQSLADALARDPALDAATDAVGANIIWDASATNERSLQYEPSVRLVGFDPKADLPWGPFRKGHATFTGESLAPDEVVLGKEAAEAFQARVGDVLTLNYSRPFDPILPTSRLLEGQINASAGGALPPPLGPYVEPQPWQTSVQVTPGAVQLSAIIGWNPVQAGAPQDLDIELVGPSNQRHANSNGTIQAPDSPAVVNVTGSLARPIESGTWTLLVHAKAGANTRFNGTIVELDPVYNLTEFQRRVDALQKQFPDFDPAKLPEFARYTTHVRVAFIMDGGKGPNFKLPSEDNLYLRLDALQGMLARPGEVNMIKLSNPGGVEDGPKEAAHVYGLAWERLNATKPRFADQPAVQAVKVSNDKVFWLDQAKRVGQIFSIFLTFVGSFSVIAGLMLIINIFTMLAEERKSELGISRAVGLRQGHLTRLFTLEGALYAFPAAVLGTFFGLGLARILIWGFNTFNQSGTFPPIPYKLVPASLLVAFSTGILLTLATVYVGARRASRLNVVRAIRNLEEPERIRGGALLWAGVAVAALGAAGSVVAFTLPSFAWQVIGPTLLVVGAGVLLRRRYSRQRIYPLLAAALFAYLSTTLFLVKRYNTVEGNIFGPVRAIAMTLCIVVLIVYNEAVAHAIGRLLRKIRRLRAVAAIAVSYPLHKKFRTGMTLAMFGVILLMVSLFTIFGALFQPDPEKEAGGYQVQGLSGLTLATLDGHGKDPALLGQSTGYDVVPYFLQIGGTLIHVGNETTGQAGPPLDYLYGVNADFAEHNRFQLLHRDARYASDADAYRALLSDPDFVIVSYTYSTDRNGNDDRHRVGDALTVDARGGPRAFTIIGIQEQFHFKGIFLSQAALRTMYSDTDTLVLFHLPPGVDADDYAHRLEANYRDVGLDAASIRTEVLKESQQFRQIFTLIQLFLSLGLIVGILSLGIVTARSIIERRQEIGMMRALGLLRRDVRRAFLLEMLTVVSLGVLIGAATAILVSFGLWVGIVRDLHIPYVIPWVDLLVIALIAYTATTLSTLGPIVRASRIPPADALRYIE